ncbi:MAG: hypothetical protein K2Y18_02335 [Alphaproteobacteria bacterium]|jgi:Leucine-rich repeat (LRR) protein|nr:hypothetical protein [Alphaproteobacteria bacterium]
MKISKWLYVFCFLSLILTHCPFSYSSEFGPVDRQIKPNLLLGNTQATPCPTNVPYIPKLISQGILRWYNSDSERDEVEIEFDLSNVSAVYATLEKLKETPYSLGLVEQTFSQNDLQELIPFASTLFRLNLIETMLDNDLLSNLTLFPHIQQLDISDNRFDDEGLEHISSLSQLLSLRMVYNKITCKGIKHLGSLKKLRFLDLGCTYLKNEGIEILSSVCNQLTTLDVRACNFDDTALRFFHNMPNLQYLNVSSNIGLTTTGIQNFLSEKRNDLVVKFDP